MSAVEAESQYWQKPVRASPVWEKCETTEALVSPVGSQPNRNYTVVSNQL